MKTTAAPKIIDFASDNVTPTHPQVIQWIAEALQSTEIPYGQDRFCAQAQNLMQKHFGPQAQAFFVNTGTGANVLSLKALCASHQAVFAADTAHIHTTECSAFEWATGAKIYPVATHHGKIIPDALEEVRNSLRPTHTNEAKVLSLTQLTEVGTAYTQNELYVLCEWARKHNLFIHMDGARLVQAAQSLGITLKEMTTDVGVDMVSFGSTKNGGLMAEAVVCLNPSLASALPWLQKQTLQLASKMSFLAAQFCALLEDDLCYKNAAIANAAAKILQEQLKMIPSLEILYPVEGNVILVEMPFELRDFLSKTHMVYTMKENTQKQTAHVRFVTSFDTTSEKIHQLILSLQESAL